MKIDPEIEAPMEFVAVEAPPRTRCGPWDKREDGIHACRKCGRLDPLDFLENDE